jgi:membrane peptidoglycan carboxypeptidase
MEKKNNMLIERLVRKAYLFEQTEQKTPEELDKMISTIRTTSLNLKKELLTLGVQEKSDPIDILNNIYNLLAKFDPVSTNVLPQYTQSNTSKAMQDVVSETKSSKKVKYYGL